LELLVVCCSFLAVDFVVLGVILLFENVSGWKLWKIGRDSMRLQKPNSYISKRTSFSYEKIISIKLRPDSISLLVNSEELTGVKYYI